MWGTRPRRGNGGCQPVEAQSAGGIRVKMFFSFWIHAITCGTILALGMPAPGMAAAGTAGPAGQCGGTVPCKCGDQVVASTTLGADLNGCRRRGLTLVAGVLDCAGHQVAGPGDRTRGEGIWIAAASGAAVRNCIVRNFGKGILVDGGSDNLIEDNEVFSNRVGVWIGDGATRIEVRGNRVHDNRDEGVHIGGGTSDNLVIENELVANATENLYLITTSRNRVIDNLLDRSSEAAILLKHSDDNYFAKNVLAKRGIAVRGDSSGNVFEKNQLLAGRFSFEAFEEELGWTFPHGNTVRGGRVIKAGTCFLFAGAYGNQVTSVLADRCRPMQEKEAGGLTPYGNRVDLNLVGGGGGGGGGDPPAPAYPKGTIKFDDPGLGRDSLRIKGLLTSAQPLDALGQDVYFGLADAGGPTFEVLAPAGTLSESGRSAEYEPSGQDRPLPGVNAIEIRRESSETWSFRLDATVDLSAANEAAMVLTVRVGTVESSFPDTWTHTSEGWRLR